MEGDFIEEIAPALIVEDGYTELSRSCRIVEVRRDSAGGLDAAVLAMALTRKLGKPVGGGMDDWLTTLGTLIDALDCGCVAMYDAGGLGLTGWILGLPCDFACCSCNVFNEGT